MDIKKIVLPIVAAGAIVFSGDQFQVTQRAVDFIAQYEGMALVPYEDKLVNPPLLTVCHGVTNLLAGNWVVRGKHYTVDECNAKEAELLEKVSKQIRPLVKVAVTQEQFEMLLSFAWNLGSNALANSTLLRKINANDCIGASQEFDRWVRAGGRVYKGLIKRRDAEEGNFVKHCTPTGHFQLVIYTIKENS